ncbi:MAG: CvpA family protein [Firmicutes bacterium]|nr:CvpA family protein [Bacillota bacterium]
MNWVDAVILALLTLGAIEGYRRGLAKSLLGIISYLAALAVALIYYQRAAEFLDKQFHLTAKIAGFLLNYLRLPSPVYSIKLAPSPVDQMLNVLRDLPLPAVYQELLRQQMGTMFLQPAGLAASIAEAIAQMIASSIVRGVAFLLLVFVVARGFQLICGVVGLVFYGRSHGGLDRLLGAGLGVLSKGVTLSLVLGLVAPFFSFMSLGQLVGQPACVALSEAINHSVLAPYFIEWFARGNLYLHQFFPGTG